MSTNDGGHIRMIATDIDGTMLRVDGSMSARTQKALHQAQAAGIHVVPATGRPLMAAYDVIEDLGLHNYWIFANGALTRHLERGETVRAYWMNPAVAQGLVVELRAKFPGAGFGLELEDDVTFEPGFQDLIPTKLRAEPIDDVLDGIHGRVQKVVVFHPELSIDELFEATCAAIGDHGVVSYTGLDFVEVGARRVTKALAIEGLCADLGVRRSEVASFGDNHNDVSMLQWCGQSFAMGNGSDDAKAAAGAVIGHTDEDGLAIKIEELLEAQS